MAAEVIDVTSLTRLYRGWRQALRTGVRQATVPGPSHAEALLAAGDRRTPLDTGHIVSAALAAVARR